jgi:3-dehydroquinate synthase
VSHGFLGAAQSRNLSPPLNALYTFFHPLFNMSDMNATVQETSTGFHVEGYEKIEYDFTFLDNVFDPRNTQLAKCYESWGRALAVTDLNVYEVYGEAMENYFKHHNITLKVHKTKIGEKAKTIPTFLSIVDSMTEFGIYRKVWLAHPIQSSRR